MVCCLASVCAAVDGVCRSVTAVTACLPACPDPRASVVSLIVHNTPHSQQLRVREQLSSPVVAPVADSSVHCMCS
jgi:hypothetical protein